MNESPQNVAAEPRKSTFRYFGMAEIPRRVIKARIKKEISEGEYLYLGWLCAVMNESSASWWSNAGAAAELGVKVRTIQKWRAHLTDLGFLTVFQKPRRAAFVIVMRNVGGSKSDHDPKGSPQHDPLGITPKGIDERRSPLPRPALTQPQITQPETPAPTTSTPEYASTERFGTVWTVFEEIKRSRRREQLQQQLLNPDNEGTVLNLLTYSDEALREAIKIALRYRTSPLEQLGIVADRADEYGQPRHAAKKGAARGTRRRKPGRKNSRLKGYEERRKTGDNPDDWFAKRDAKGAGQ